MAGSSGTGGPTEIDRLLYFIAAVVAFLVLVPAALGFAGFDVRNGSLLGGADGGTDAEGVQILTAFGTGIDGDRSSVGVVEVVVTSGGGSTVDFSEATVSWEGSERYELTPANVNLGQGSFSLSGETVLAEPTDRAILRFDLGSDDLEGVDHFGERLEPGETVQFSVVTEDVVRTGRQLVVPDPLPSGAGVSL